MLLTFADNESQKNKNVKMATSVILLLVAIFIGWRYFREDESVRHAADRGFMCSECGKAFDYVIKSGDMEPLSCPVCKKMTGYQAERCYWTKNAQGEWVAKAEPTYVLLKTRVNPDSEEKTFCPDCGREVVGHNPQPSAELMEKASSH